MVHKIIKELILPLYPKALDWVRELDKDEHIIEVIKDKDIVLGLIIIRKRDKKLCTLVLYPEYRNKGIGTNIIRKYKKHIKYVKSVVESLRYFYEKNDILFILDKRNKY